MPPGTRGPSAPCSGSVLHVSRIFAGRRDQVGPARRFVRKALATCPSANDAVLLTSELAANAVLHTASGEGGSFSIAVRHTGALVRVEVTDGGSATAPTVGPVGSLGLSARGLVLVSLVAARWDHEGRPSARLVWFELDCL